MSTQHTRPNIVFVLADDMGYGDFSAFNEGRSSTPTLDALMGESICLTQHFAASPVCNPSRASIMTGRYPHRTGSIDTLDWRGLDRLALREVTLADALKTAGYATALVGKWHLGAFDPRYHPNARGFDEFAGFRGGWSRYYKWQIECNGRKQKADGRYLTDVFTEEAVGFIERHKREPFFLHLTYNAPHTPLEAPDEDVKPFLDTGRFNTGVSMLYGMIRHLDAGIARVLDTLEKYGLADNTLVLFTSDNGPQFSGEGDMAIRRFNCGFNGSKGTVYEGGIRVPAILRWPDGLDANKQIHEMAHMTDWFPTVLAMAGVPHPPETRALDGDNILPVLRGEPFKVNPRRFWQWNRLEPEITCNAAMRDGDWKLVRPEIKECMSFPSDECRWNELMRDDPDAMTDICRAPIPPREAPPRRRQNSTTSPTTPSSSTTSPTTTPTAPARCSASSRSGSNTSKPSARRFKTSGNRNRPRPPPRPRPFPPPASAPTATSAQPQIPSRKALDLAPFVH